MPRFWEIDFARGTAILMMAAFHFAWDLNYFGVISASLYTGYWGIFQKATLSLFLFIAGVVLAVNRGIKRQEFLYGSVRRGMIVFGCGMLVTIFTFAFFREQFVYFGVLHLIGIALILSAPLAGKRMLSLLLGVAIIVLPSTVNLQHLGLQPFMWVGLAEPKPALDFVPLFPWFGLMLLGIFAGNTLYRNGARKFGIHEARGRLTGFMQALGRNTLLIYLAHQGILFPLAYAVSLLA